MHSSRAIASAVLLAGCVTQGGTPVSDAQMGELARGRSRYEEVVARLGRPTVATAAPDGFRILIYKSERMKVGDAKLIPLVGSFLGGTEERNSWVTFFLDRTGVLTDWRVERESKVHRLP